MSFSEDIKNLRLNALLTQDEFAKLLGVSYTTVNRWENGKSTPGMKALKLIAQYCKKCWEYLAVFDNIITFAAKY